MRSRVIVITLLGTLMCLSISAQNARLKELSDDVLLLRKATKEIQNKMVLELSASDRPKITLMDEIKADPHEYRGKGANRFMMNQVVTFVYSRQNTIMVSKGDFFNSTEKGIYYSAIEKTIKKGEMATYTISGHEGIQEFMFIPFDPKTKYSVTVNNVKAKLINDGISYINLGRVGKNDIISFSISLDKSNVTAFESFVILNYNPQK